MPLSASDLGDRQTWPVRYVRAGKPTIHPTKVGAGTFTPTMIYTQRWVDTSTIVTNKFAESQAGPAATANLTLTATLSSTYARNVVITVTHASSIVAMTFLVTGTDEYGVAITETLDITATGTSKTATGVKAFKTIVTILATVAATSVDNTVIAGDGKVLGLSFRTLTASAIKEYEDTTIRTNGVIVVGSDTTTLDYRGTYTPNATLNGALDFTIQYFVEDPTVI